ncbi:hypothetical protein HPB51_029577 [Rhipicephalus microplus]|uniref:EF-hand domain-containing protein n=1 Tax=Rhipicephalus microplus TaxID=6941 RepID=A0A9J6CTT5_RHIMP|nr:hypothetical protein HPB51_029577 [Rhipicephalus microplus]
MKLQANGAPKNGQPLQHPPHYYPELPTEVEERLEKLFRKLDVNEDGSLDANEIRTSFQKLGIQIETDEAMRLLKRMDKDGSLTISFEEWRDYLLFHPSSEIHDIIHHWRHATFVDLGEDSLVPDDFTEEEIHTGMWWRHLVAGGVAGAVSRTCTAPLDRLKVFLQVRGSEFQSIQQCLRHMLQEGGIPSLWRGNGINVIKIAPESALKFLAYEKAKRLIKGDSNRDLGIFERFFAGSLAGSIAQTSIYPMELALSIAERHTYEDIDHKQESLRITASERTITTDVKVERMDSRKTNILEGKHFISARRKGQRLDRRVRKKLAELNKTIEEYCVVLS